MLYLDRYGAYVTPSTRRLAKAEALANEPTPDVDDSVATAIAFIRDLSPAQRPQKAGGCSRKFWSTEVLAANVSKNNPGPT